ncbi:hypothetical protein KJF94_18780 [Pseudomonas hormoni]|uniref:Uncharacterized protein n=1 Tax=Pseudomonas hormoni TaxID=3093767 RepID=A0ABX8EQJ9_9PSED|nr:hypothetical protein [Pseudomonas hormoni]QVW21924.1 hypothetical protein KJF94_18780 [Pseudomonas hormoni]
MRSVLMIIVTALSWQFAYADGCPDDISTSQGSFSLRTFIILHGDQSLATARKQLETSSNQNCDTTAKNEACKASREALAKVVDTLTACANPQSQSQKAARTPTAKTNQPNSKQKSAQEPSKSSINNVLAQNDRHSENSANENFKSNDEANGCSYLTQYVPGAFHKLNTYVCIGNSTKRCEIMGKNAKQEVIYDWLAVSDTSCIHGDGWIDINAVELNTLNSRKNTKAFKPD